ncbi:hypothetical protein NM688_g8703 [Phlebia brevispora]|uniref:Uncharacterized protein n=1 Tax=Phlebia brevispora TaxID=194682 RepID=A0ACC1RSD1_9APHY|nr:hypothetical protein NM688_g8703 [Phlebia brevispora]
MRLFRINSLFRSAETPADLCAPHLSVAPGPLRRVYFTERAPSAHSVLIFSLFSANTQPDIPTRPVPRSALPKIGCSLPYQAIAYVTRGASAANRSVKRTFVSSSLAFIVTAALVDMLPIPPAALFAASHAIALAAYPAQELLAMGRPLVNRFYDVQAHRGGRGNTVENTLPSFAWGLIDGATTLELDNGITKDGQVVVWHDEEVTAAKCLDTAPAFPGDPDYPYVGKFVANLTLAQIKTIDCGSLRQEGYPFQLTYPGTRISTLGEVFDFVECADPGRQVQWNIESKINAKYPNQTKGVEEFVSKQYEVFSNSPYKHSITYQSFDWRTLVSMKKLDPTMITSALIDSDTASGPGNSTTPWLAGLNLEAFPGPTFDRRVAQAARYIHADVLSPAAVHDDSPVKDPALPGYIPFTTKEMIEEAHGLGVEVKPWTVNRLNIAEQLLEWDADGIISDYPNAVRRLARQKNLPVAPKYPKQRVLTCLDEHLGRQRQTVHS